MEAKKYCIKINYSKIDFPPLNGLARQSILTMLEPLTVVGNKLSLKINKTLLIIETYNNVEHEILKAQSVYEIPVSDIKDKEGVYEFYKDATSNLFQGYEQAQKEIPLPVMTVPPPEPIDNYKQDFDYIFNFIQTLN
jgi:hypothetical protein